MASRGKGVASVVFVIAAVGCGSSQPVPASSAGPGSGDTTGPAATAATATATAAEEEPAKRFRSLDLTSVCSRDLHLWFGAHPGDGHGEAAVVATGATIPVPRQADGTNVVWVLDDKGFGLASVNITKNMRHIRIDAACMKIDADSTR
jgi:hypothetical protein